MALASAIGGFASGLASGLKLGQDMNESEQRRKLALEQAERDKTRFNFEKEEFEDKSARRKRVAQAEKELENIESLLTGGKLTDEQPQQAAPTTAIATPTPPVEPQPMVESGTPTPRAAITPPGAQPAPAQQPAANPFLTGAEKYKDPNAAMDKYYDMKEAALTKLFRARGEYDKAEQVPEMMRQLKEQKWSQKVGVSLAAMAGNAPGAREAFGRVYSLFADGYELDPTKGKFEEGKGWVGLERVNTETGARETFNMTPEQAMGYASRYKKPDEVIKFLLDRGDKARQEKREDTKVENDTTRAKAAAAEVEIKRPYYSAYAGYLERRGKDEANTQQQRASVEAAARMFPLAVKEYKPEELMLDKDQGKARLEKKAADERMYNKTLDLAGLNPKVDIRTLGQIARQGKVEAQEDADGRVFTMVGKTKVFLN